MADHPDVTDATDSPEPVPLHAYWMLNRDVLREFLRAVETIRHSVEDACKTHLGVEITKVMSLRTQLFVATDLQLWAPADGALFHRCILIRRAILSQGQKQTTAHDLSQHTRSLLELAERLGHDA